MHSEITASAEPREVPYAKRWQRSGGLQCPCIYRIGRCRNVRGLRKNMVVLRLHEKLRYSNERSTKFESLYHDYKHLEKENGKMAALQISPKLESLYGLGRQATKL